MEIFISMSKIWSRTLSVFFICLIQGHLCYTPEDGSNVILDHDNNAGCPIAFHRIGDKCYFYGYFKLNWFRAMEFCHSFGSSVSLACIESPQENDYLKNWLIEYGDHTTGVWVGGSDNGHVGRWAWFPTGQLIKNFNWGPSQPNGGDQHCMYIVGGYLGYQWADFHCGFEMTFLCEYDVNDIEAWRRRRQYRGNQNIVQSPLLKKKQDQQIDHQDKYALNIHYGFTNETQKNTKQTVPNKISNNIKKVIDQQNDISDTNIETVKVTKKPYRNSVVISTMTKSSTATTTNRITENDSNNNNNADQNSSDKDDWTVYNFLKSIVKLG